MRKSTQRRIEIYLLPLILLLQTIIHVNGQEATAYWPLTLANHEIIINGNITAAGPIPIGIRYAQNKDYAVINMDNSSTLISDQYFQFEIAPAQGFSLYASKITALMNIAASFVAKAQVWISLSPDFNEFTIIANEFAIPAGSNFTIYDFNLNKTVQDGEKLYIRFYPYGYSTISDSFSIKLTDVEFTGNTSSSTSLSYEKEEWCTNEGIAEANLTGPEGGSYSSDTGLSINSSTGEIDLANCTPGSYTVNYTHSDAVIATTDITVVLASECAINGPEGPVRPSSTYTYLAPEGMSAYSWIVSGNAAISGSTNTHSATVITGPENEGSFTLSLSVQNNGCSGSCTKVVPVEEDNQGQLPTASLAGTQSICLGNSAVLTVNLTGQPPWTFTWTDGIDEFTVSETNDPIHKITVNPTATTTYSLTGVVTDDTGNSNNITGEAKVYISPITSVPNIVACPGNTIDIPIKVDNFKEVRDISLTLQYDSRVMTFQDFENGDIENYDGIQVSDFPLNGELRALRISNFSEENLPALADNSTLLNLQFNYHGGISDLKWIDSPDDSWCSYSFLSVLDETGFETETFCDLPAEAYYINGSVNQLSVSGIDVGQIQHVSTITGTPVVIPVSVTYPDLEAQEVSPVVLTDARIIYNETGSFPEGTHIFKINYNGVTVLSSSFDLSGKNEVLLSEILGTPPTPLIGHSKQTVNWEIYIDGIHSSAEVPLNIEALAYTEISECTIVLDTESFVVSFANASLSLAESVAVCGTYPIPFTAEIAYPEILNVNSSIKADARISSTTPFPKETIIKWTYNNNVSGNYTLPASTSEIMLSTIVGTLPSSLQGHSETDVWSLEISNAGLMAGNELTIQAVALLDGEYYIYSEDNISITVNPLPELSAVSIITSTDENSWTGITGNLTEGYTLCADPAEEFHYLDIEIVTGTVELSNEFIKNAFYLDVNSVPTGYLEYWDAKGVNESATTGWQAVMWDIITAMEPMFYISYDGTDYKLIDGMQYKYDNGAASYLRISGDYPAGNYSFSGTVTDVNGCISEEMNISLQLNSAPEIICPGEIITANDAGKCGASVSFAATATGSPAPEITYSLPDGTLIEPGHFFPAGKTSVTATANNSCKTVSCVFDIIVNDNEKPAITCQVDENINVKLTSYSSYMHNGTGWNPIVSDNCSVYAVSYTLSGATEGTGNNLDGTIFNPGITIVTWNVTDLSDNTNECSFSVTVSGVSMSGRVMYYNQENTPLEDVSIVLKDPGSNAEVAKTITGNGGEYYFAQLCPGMYDVEITTDKPVRSINSTDAGQVNAWAVAQSGSIWPSIEKVRFLAGDVNGDNYIIAQDAGMIQNHFLTFGTEVAFDNLWEFWKINNQITLQPQTDNILRVNLASESNELIQDFHGLVSGDFNRSNVPATTGVYSLLAKSAHTEEGMVTLLKGNALVADAGSVTELPVRAVSKMKVGAISLIMDLQVDRFQVVDVYLKNNPNQPAGFNVMDNKLVIGWNSLNALSVEAGEPLVTLRLKTTGKNSALPVFLELASNPLNELADENMMAIENASLIMDGLITKKTTTGLKTTTGEELMLYCHPSPFKEHFTISYILPAEGNVNVEITDISGKIISILPEQKQPSGEHTINFHKNNMIPGVYNVSLRFTELNGQTKVITTKIIKQ